MAGYLPELADYFENRICRLQDNGDDQICELTTTQIAGILMLGFYAKGKMAPLPCRHKALHTAYEENEREIDSVIAQHNGDFVRCVFQWGRSKLIQAQLFALPLANDALEQLLSGNHDILPGFASFDVKCTCRNRTCKQNLPTDAVVTSGDASPSHLVTADPLPPLSINTTFGGETGDGQQPHQQALLLMLADQQLPTQEDHMTQVCIWQCLVGDR